MFGSNPFGQPSSSPFGTQPAFGQQNTAANNPFSGRLFGSTSPFGAQTAFGQPSSSPRTQPAFGQQNTAANNPFAGSHIGSTNPFGAQTGSALFGGNSTGVFGATPAPSPLATSTPAFRSSSTPEFGSSTTPAFGASSTPAFGASSAPAFGSSSTPAFRSSTTPAFGASSTPAFGSNSSQFGATSVFGQKPAFGGFGSPNPAQSSPFGSTFGQTQPGFGSQPFGSATSQPAFGSTSTPSFGFSSSSSFSQPANAFGAASTPAFGNSPSPFGVQSTTSTFGSPGFGQTPFGGQRGGTRVVPYTTTNEADTGSVVGGQTSSTPGKLISISAMPQYKEKRLEDLRWEDYQLGDKGGPNPASQQPAGGLFSQPAQSSSFGQTTPSAFGQMTSAFGQTTSAFGQASAANLFSSTSPGKFNSPFGATSSSSPFGTVSSSPSLFGSSTTSAFGGASSASPFGTSSSPAFAVTPFGQASQPASLFGSTPSLGSSSAFGSSTPFGNAQSSGLFQSSTPVFGQSTPAFGQSTPAFGQSTPAFGFEQIPIGGKHGGSRAAPYTATDETDGVSSVKLLSISAMPEYKERSHEEIRWEEYQSGDKGVAFSQPTQSSPFGQTTSAFGHTGTSAFGQMTGFGQAFLANLFSDIPSGMFQNKEKMFCNTTFDSLSDAAFKSPFGPTLSSPFGKVSSSPSLFRPSELDCRWASSASPFGTSNSPAFVSTPFGQASQPGSFCGSTPSLGSSPAFGCTNSFRNAQSGLFKSPTPAFGQTATVFGQTTPAFGKTTNVFGQITPAYVCNLFSNGTTSMMFESKLAGQTQSQPSMFGGFQDHIPTQTQGGSFSFNFGQPHPTGEMEASNFQISKVARRKHTGELEKVNKESAITLIFQRMDKDKEIMEGLKEKVEQLTSCVENLVVTIQSSATMPTPPFLDVAYKDMPPGGDIGCMVKATKSWMEDLIALCSKHIDEAVILYHKIHDELNCLADIKKKFDEELQGLERRLSQIKEMVDIDFDILVAEKFFDGSDSNLHIEWLKATEWRIEVLEEGKTRFNEGEGIAHDALSDIQDFVEKLQCNFYDDQRSINSADVMKDQLANVIKEELSLLDIAGIDRLMKLKILCWKFERKLIEYCKVPCKVSNIHKSQDFRFRYFKGPNQAGVKEAIDKFRQYQKRVCNSEKVTINIEDREEALDEGR